MADDLKRLSDLTHSGEELLESLRCARDNAEIDALMECVLRWSEELIALGETIDPIRLRFRMMRPTLEQTARIHSSYSELRGDQQGYCNYAEAALGDLNAYLRQPVARPKGKGGNRIAFNDDVIAGKAHAIRKKKGIKTNKGAALEAMRLYPKLYEGRGTDDSIARRIARHMVKKYGS